MQSLTKNNYDKISENWKGSIYETWERMGPRVELFDKVLGQLKGKNVLEVGSNAGVYAYLLSSVVSSYVGIEKSKNYYKQSISTLKYIENPNVKFVNIRAGKYLKRCLAPHINAFVALNVLYHLSNKELLMLQADLFPLCSVIVIQTRDEGKRVEKNDFELFNVDNVIKFIGMEKCKIYTKDSVSLIVGEK